MKKELIITKEFFKYAKKSFKDNSSSIIKGIATSILIVYLAVLFIPFFNDFVCKYIEPYTNKLLDLDNRIFIFLDWGVILLSILTLAITIDRCKQNKIWNFPSLLFNIFLFSVIIWGYESFISQEWIQLDIFDTGIAYSSLVIFLLFTALIVYFYFWVKSILVQIKNKLDLQSNNRLSQRKNYAHTDDSPIVKAKDDILGRKTFALNLASLIYNLDGKKGACSIAINSPWGYGKTSFLNLVKEQLEQFSEVIIIGFSPWHFSPSTEITKMFFSRLENEFKGINKELSDFFKEYSDLLNETDYSFVQKMFRRKKDYESLLSDISRHLEKSDKKLIIIIDDFDRLSAAEIQEVLRLIRGSANFPNFIFLTAFDKDYVQKVLSESSNAITPQYIEKFFEHEYNLPIYSKTILKDEIIRIAEQFLEENDLQAFKQYISQDTSLYNKRYVFERLRNLRCVYRWLNNISLKYKILKGECMIEDLADIELLNMLYPKIYAALEQHMEEYLIAEQGTNYVLYDDTKFNNDRMGWFNKKAHTDLRKEPIYTYLSDRDKKTLDNILNRLLPNNYYRSCPKSFRDSNYTYRYFYQDLSDNDMSDEEFIIFINQHFNNIKDILNKDEENKYIKLIWLHSKDQAIESKDDIKHLLPIMYYAMARYGKYFDFEIISKYLEKLELTDSEKKRYLISLIYENGFSWGVVACYSLWNPNRAIWHKYLSEDDMNEILKTMLQYAIEDGLSYEDVRDCHMRASVIAKIKNEDGKQIEKEEFPITGIEDLYQTYIAKSFVKIIPNLIWQNRKDDIHEEEYYLSTDFTRYWNSWTSFEDFCQDAQIKIPIDNNDVYEFQEFVKAYNANDNKPLKFKFKNIKLSK